jgi:membrane-bound metal-dependent hydrolase YbcI (DUF457 family)
MVPALSLIVLARTKELNAKLSVIAGFNAVISICLLWFTEAKRVDIFAVKAV